MTLAQIARKADKYKFVKKSFLALKKSSAEIVRSFHVANHELNIGKNRHNMLPFDITRTCRELNDFYINANDVSTPVQDYIVTQGPLNSTIPDFWKTVLHSNVELIVTLVMAQEEGRDKCADYWEVSQLPIQVDSWRINHTNTKVVSTCPTITSHRIIVREFLAKNGSEERTIKQIHYENWPDNKIPDVDLFVDLLDTVDQNIRTHTSPIVVHCSAGIGRSGTFVAAHSLRKEYRQTMLQRKKKSPVRLNIAKAVFLLRCQRIHLVGTAKQYQVIFQALAKEHQPREKPLLVF